MPMHDWTRVPAAIFHAFHHSWLSSLADVLNSIGLPDDHYALPEQHAVAGEGTEESDAEFYRRRKSSIAVRHVSGDRMVAVLEIVSPGNKSTNHAIKAFVDKACELLEHRIHLLIVDPFPPGPRDPAGVHAAIWQEMKDESFAVMPADKPLTLVAYECSLTTRAYIEPVAVGDRLPDMPLFLEAEAHVRVPLEPTYNTAFANMPRRWRTVLDPRS
jgi:hypothetical protein